MFEKVGLCSGDLLLGMLTEQTISALMQHLLTSSQCTCPATASTSDYCSRHTINIAPIFSHKDDHQGTICHMTKLRTTSCMTI